MTSSGLTWISHSSWRPRRCGSPVRITRAFASQQARSLLLSQLCLSPSLLSPLQPFSSPHRTPPFTAHYPRPPPPTPARRASSPPSGQTRANRRCPTRARCWRWRCWTRMWGRSSGSGGRRWRRYSRCGRGAARRPWRFGWLFDGPGAFALNMQNASPPTPLHPSQPPLPTPKTHTAPNKTERQGRH